MKKKDTKKVKKLMKKLRCLEDFYQANHGEGHTKLMNQGLSDSDAMFCMIEEDMVHVTDDEGKYQGIGFSLDKHPEMLRKVDVPMAWDNSAISFLLADTLEAMEIMAEELTKFKLVGKKK